MNINKKEIREETDRSDSIFRSRSSMVETGMLFIKDGVLLYFPVQILNCFNLSLPSNEPRQLNKLGFNKCCALV